jgi:exodeoxyribonuclease V alpha subunit
MHEVEGFIDSIVFRNENNGYSVLSIKTGNRQVSAVGIAPSFSEGERVLITGEWAEHPDYGRQIKIASIESVRPTTLHGIERYLGSGVIRGVGPATAKLIVSRFGKDALDILDADPERLTQIDGIGPKRARMIYASYAAQREMRQTMVFMQSYGLSPLMAMKVYKVFGDRAQAVLRADPYLLVEKVDGIGFKLADRIAYSLGIERESEHRLTCGLQYAMDEAVAAEGHMYLPEDVLLARAQRLLAVDVSLISVALKKLVLLGLLVGTQLEGETVYYERRLYDAECEVASRLKRLVASIEDADEVTVDKKIAKYERGEGIRLCAEQRDAVRAAATGGVTIITGGPGTGKTTSINLIIRLMTGGRVALCAPTGRAAKRMSLATGHEAKTIHRLLEYAGDEEIFTKNQDDPLDASAVIVDEMSMVDIHLMCALLRAIKPGTRLVLVGDADQLPSVGAGNVLRDLIDSGALHVAKLTEIFRQANESMIVRNAHRINHGEMPIVNAKDTDFFFVGAKTAADAQASVLGLVGTRLPKYGGYDALRDIQLMSPMKKGESGVYALNRLLQEALNPPGGGKAQISRGDTLFREGDKVMQMRNNYQLEWTRGDEAGAGVFNGDIGFIESIDAEDRALTIRFDDEREAVYTEAELADLELSYCMSVHKSQGSEFEAVVLPVLSGPKMLMTRNLFYTAVTRARKIVVLVGREECVRQMIQNNHIQRRYSALADRVRNLREA